MSALAFSRIISPNDVMWKTGEAWYFDVGLSAVQCVRRALNGAAPRTILDLPCGHGRVCRMLHAAYPDAHITACDLDRDGVDFCAAEFGATPVYSTADVRELSLGGRFDLIWCGSLMTHVPRDEWQAWLQFFGDHLNDGGTLVFTTHGQQSVRFMRDGAYSYGLSADEQHAWMDQYAAEGFGWIVPAGQTYGHSLTATAFVTGVLDEIPALELVGFTDAGWANHQDVFTCRGRAQAAQAGTRAIGPTWCPCCRAAASFVERGPWLRDQYVCEQCGSIPRQRAVNHVLDTYFPTWTTLSIHEGSPSNHFISRFASHYSHSFLLEGVPLGATKGGAHCEDLERLTFPDGRFDLFVTQDVLEHVFRPDRALQQVMRVLRAGGAHVFTAPRHADRPRSRRRAVQDGDAVIHLHPAEYHGNPVGDGRALVTWDYGRDAEALFTEWSGYPTASYVIRDRRLGLDGEFLEVFVTRKTV